MGINKNKTKVARKKTQKNGNKVVKINNSMNTTLKINDSMNITPKINASMVPVARVNTSMNTTTDAVWSICNNPERIIDIYNGKSGKIIIHDSDIKDRLTYIMLTNSLLTRLEINPWSIGNYRGDTLWNKIDDNSLSILKNKSCHDVSCPDCPIKTMLDAPIPTCHATFGNRLFMCNATLIYLILKWGTKKTKEMIVEALL